MEDIPIIRLNEKSLRRLSEKLEKLEAVKATKGDAPIKKKELRSRFEVYKPGVTRLSKRAPQTDAAGADCVENVGDSGSKRIATEERLGRLSLKSGDNVKSSAGRGRSKFKSQSHNKSPDKGSRTKGRGRQSARRDNRPPHEGNRALPNDRQYSSENDDSEDMEEGYLTRQNRRRRGRPNARSHDYSSNDDIEIEDELAWDNYSHGRFLESWSDNSLSVATTPEDVKTDVIEDSSYEIQRHNEQVKARSYDRTVVHNDKEKGKMQSVMKEDNAKKDSGHLSKAPHQPENNKESKTERMQIPRKQLYDPSNPDTPIMVPSSQRLRSNIGSSKAYPNESDETISDDIRQSRPYQPYSELQSWYPQTYNNQDLWHNNQDNYSPMKRYRDVTPQLYADSMPQMREHTAERYASTEYDSEKPRNVPRQTYKDYLEEVAIHDAAIRSLLAYADFSLRSFNDKLLSSRTKLKKISEKLILNYIEVSTKHNVEQTLWKSAYHQVLEKLRDQIAACTEDDKNELKSLLIVMLDQATSFYENLLTRLQQSYKIDLKEMWANVMLSKSIQKHAGKKTKLAAMSCQRTLICLGDLARYYENANNSSNFGKARHFYIQARSLEPRNGRPYNQLALLAVQTRRKLDAVYYHARSLATTGNPILTARESLIALFDDARRKFEYIKKNDETKSSTKPTSSSTSRAMKLSSANQPKTVWIHADQTNDPREIEEPSDPSTVENAETVTSSANLTPNQMLKHFTLIFMHIHGKLFTKVGLDTFDKLKDELLHLFEKLLHSEQMLLNKQTLLHLFAINFFSVFNQHQRNKTESSDGTLSSRAVQLVFSMIALLTHKAVALLQHLPCNAGVYDPSSNSRFEVILPALKVACDWMYCNRDLWYPRPPTRPHNRLHDIWSNLAVLCDWLCTDSRHFPVRVFTQSHHDLEEVNLPEDFEFSGFAPLSQTEYEPRFVLMTSYSMPEQAQTVHDCVRLDLIRDFLEYLCGMEHPLLAFKQGRYVVLVEAAVDPVEAVHQRLSHSEDAVQEIANVDDESVDYRDFSYTDDVQHDDDLYQLRVLRDSLQKEKLDHDRRQYQIQASLNSAEQRDTTMYVKPQNLIPDTNCFIDHLDLIQALLEAGPYLVCVPLVVLAELEGLSQESKGANEHALRVNANAVKAVGFLHLKFSERNTKLQAITNQGSVLSTILFQSQYDMDDKGSNDDLILQCCTKYEERNNNENFRTRYAVLLTDDRNLRVKALARNTPTRSLSEFCKWAGITKVSV